MIDTTAGGKSNTCIESIFTYKESIHLFYFFTDINQSPSWSYSLLCKFPDLSMYFCCSPHVLDLFFYQFFHFPLLSISCSSESVILVIFNDISNGKLILFELLKHRNSRRNSLFDICIFRPVFHYSEYTIILETSLFDFRVFSYYFFNESGLLDIHLFFFDFLFIFGYLLV